MKLGVDAKKTYTYGDWVRVTVSIDPTRITVREIQAELRGHFSVSFGNKQKTVTLYVSNQVVKLPQSHIFGGTLQISVQFPGRELGLNLPPTLISHPTFKDVTCCHTLRVRAVKRKPFKPCSFQSVELQFIPSDIISPLSALRVMYNEHCQKGLPVLAELTTPLCFAQGVGQRISIRLLNREVTGLHMLRVHIELAWIGRCNFILGRIAWKDHRIFAWAINNTSEADEITTKIAIPQCVLPTHQSTDFDCGYVLRVQLTLLKLKTRRCLSLNFNKPIQILSAPLYKDQSGCPATDEEIHVMVSAGEKSSTPSSSTALNARSKFIEAEVVAQSLPLYQLQ